jgi:CheY-like chemotaxis protein
MIDNKKIVQTYLAAHAVLVVDKNSSSRSRLLKVMVDLGTKRNMVFTAGTMQEADEIMRSQKLGLVISDYEVGGGSGFDLFKIVREKFAENKDLCLILVTSNISQSAVAKAAEEDVDSFIIKPYTMQSIQENLVSTISSKIKPSPYIVKIEQGKKLLSEGLYVDAQKIFEAALTMHPKPSLAMFYLGQAQYLQSEKEQAKVKYNKGLGFNSIHFKCLIGLYDLFMKDNKYDEAYQILKKIVKYFPANPDRLSQIIRLAIITKNYEDMESFYEIFTQLDERNAQMVNYVGAGMYVSGKWYLQSGKPGPALAIFEKIAVSCSEFPKFLRAVITSLIEFDQGAKADKFLSRFHSGIMDHEDYLVSDFLVRAAQGGDLGQVIQRGIDLYNRKIRDYHALKFLIAAMKSQGLGDKAKPFIEELTNLYPDRDSGRAAG